MWGVDGTQFLGRQCRQMDTCASPASGPTRADQEPGNLLAGAKKQRWVVGWLGEAPLVVGVSAAAQKRPDIPSFNHCARGLLCAGFDPVTLWPMQSHRCYCIPTASISRPSSGEWRVWGWRRLTPR